MKVRKLDVSGKTMNRKKLKSSVFGKKRIFFSAEMQISKQKRGSEIKNNYSNFITKKNISFEHSCCFWAFTAPQLFSIAYNLCIKFYYIVLGCCGGGLMVTTKPSLSQTGCLKHCAANSSSQDSIDFGLRLVRTVGRGPKFEPNCQHCPFVKLKHLAT